MTWLGNSLTTNDIDQVLTPDDLGRPSAFEVKTVKPKKEFGPCLPVLADGQPFKRYAVFAGNLITVYRGWDSFRGAFATREEAYALLRSDGWRRDGIWWEIVDLLICLAIDSNIE